MTGNRGDGEQGDRVSAADQVLNVDSDEPSSRPPDEPSLPVSTSSSAGRAPPTKPTERTSKRWPKNLLELITYVIDDPARTRRLAVLIATTGLSTASIIFVIQLQPDRWASVLAVTASVVSLAQFGRSRTKRGSLRRPAPRNRAKNRNADVAEVASSTANQRRAPRQP
jgi:hypothetical protein